MGKKEVKILLFSDEIIVYTSEPKNSPRKLLLLINAFYKVAGSKINSQKSASFQYKMTNKLRKKRNQVSNSLYTILKEYEMF